jgi:hypothetical protein
MRPRVANLEILCHFFNEKDKPERSETCLATDILHSSSAMPYVTNSYFQLQYVTSFM